MPSGNNKPKRWRPWQPVLRTLLLLMFGVACFLGGWQANEWKRQRELEYFLKAASSFSGYEVFGDGPSQDE